MGRGDQADHGEDMEDSIDLEGISEGSDEEDRAANSLFFEEDEYGELYDGEEEEDGDWGTGEDEDGETDGSCDCNGDARMEEGGESEEEEL